MADMFKFAQGPARPATAEEIARENTLEHKTNPDLHRRIDNTLTAYISEDAYLLTAEGDYLLGSTANDTPVTIDNLETEDGDPIETEDGITIQIESSETPDPGDIFYLIANTMTDTGYPQTHALSVQGVNSFRTTTTKTHTEESTTSEIP